MAEFSADANSEAKSETKESKMRRKWKPARRSPDSEGVFEIEGLENHDVRPYLESEDEELSGEERKEETSDLNGSSRQLSKQYATSLPIKVPVWTFNHEDKSSDDEKVTSLDAPERIAESIKQLAMSVRDGTEMFGDLPRRRLNTGDLVKSRPI